MKTNKKLYISASVVLAAMTLQACDDYLEVDSPSSFFDDYTFGTRDEMSKSLNAVYAYMLSSNTYGGAYIQTYCLNSDVELATNGSETQNQSGSGYRYFDATADGSAIANTWRDAYTNIEYANNFIENAMATTMYADVKDKDYEAVRQMVGEAKCIRAMNYFDLVVLCGEVPFTFSRTVDNYDNLIMPMASDRNAILDALINDLIAAAPDMKFARESGVSVERCSKEFAWSLIARIALFRAGYSLRPEGASGYAMKRADDYMNYYKLAAQYCDSVIAKSGHDLVKSYRQVFVDECNYVVSNNDDPIFEIPLTTGSSGSVGYVHGPSVSWTSNDYDSYGYGSSNGGLQLNAFYRWSFDTLDLRRDFVVGYWDYKDNWTDSKGVNHTNVEGSPSLNIGGLTYRCNKWSKLWRNNGGFGNSSSGSTGINFPYMRYADVLLMYAEALNEINGGATEEALAALNKVRKRAGLAEVTEADHDKFFTAIFNERAWEFAGENIRWKDLVRWNKLSEVIFRQFWNYYEFASDYGSGADEARINEFCTYYYDNKSVDDNQTKIIKYGLDKMSSYTNWYYKYMPNPGSIDSYPCLNSSYRVLDILNLWGTPAGFTKPSDSEYIRPGSDLSSSWIDGDGNVRPAARLSFRGYIWSNSSGVLQGAATASLGALPPVRYILPIPRTFVNRSNGQYVNHYGY
jgi:hypothetical protein